MKNLIIYNAETGIPYFSYDFKKRTIIDDQGMITGFLSAIQNYAKDVYRGELKVMKIEIDGIQKVVFSRIDNYGIAISMRLDEDEEVGKWLANEILMAFKEIYDPIIKTHELSFTNIFYGFEYIVKKILKEKEFKEKLIKDSIEDPFYSECKVSKRDLCVGDRFTVTIKLLLKETEVTKIEYPTLIKIENIVPILVANVIDTNPRSLQKIERGVFLENMELRNILRIDIVLEASREGKDEISPIIEYKIGGRVLSHAVGHITINVKKC